MKIPQKVGKTNEKMKDFRTLELKISVETFDNLTFFYTDQENRLGTIRKVEKIWFTYGQSDSFRPGKGARRAIVVGDTHRERVIATVGRQQVLARALEIEHSPVERPVMRIAKHGAHGVICRSKRIRYQISTSAYIYSIV